MHDVKTQDIDRILAEQSAELLEALKRNEPGSHERLTAWLGESRRHVQHYLMMVALDRELEFIDAERQWDIGPTADARQKNVISLSKPLAVTSLRPMERRRFWSFAAAFLASVLLLGGAYWFTSQKSEREVTTAVGEQRAIELDDGSVVHLNTQSHIKLNFSAHRRDVRLLAGEALFKVHHDSARPFRVYTSDAVIQAVGTEFNVYRRAQGTMVSVLEGRVRVLNDKLQPVRSASLGAGQQAQIDHAGKVATVEAADLGSLTAWRQRRLIFKSTPLPQMVAEFNRYNRAPHLQLEGSNAPERAFSGIFDADDPESLIELLRREPGLVVERNGSNVTIRVGAGTHFESQ